MNIPLGFCTEPQILWENASVNWSLILEYCGGQKTYSNPGNLEKAVTELFGEGITQVYSDLCSPRFCCSNGCVHIFMVKMRFRKQREKDKFILGLFSWNVKRPNKKLDMYTWRLRTEFQDTMKKETIGQYPWWTWMQKSSTKY